MGRDQKGQHSQHLDAPKIQHPICDTLHTTYFNIIADRVLGTASIPAVITFVNVVTLLPVTVCLLQTNPFHSNTACVPRRAWVTTKSWIQVCASNPRITWLSQITLKIDKTCLVNSHSKHLSWFLHYLTLSSTVSATTYHGL